MIERDSFCYDLYGMKSQFKEAKSNFKTAL